MDDEGIEKWLRGRAENAACISVFLALAALGLIALVWGVLGAGGG